MRLSTSSGNLDLRKGAKFRPEDYKLSELNADLLDELRQGRRPEWCWRAALGRRINAADNWQVIAVESGSWSCRGQSIGPLSLSPTNLGKVREAEK